MKEYLPMIQSEIRRLAEQNQSTYTCYIPLENEYMPFTFSEFIQFVSEGLEGFEIRTCSSNIEDAASYIIISW
jgi:hypothetical protein